MIEVLAGYGQDLTPYGIGDVLHEIDGVERELARASRRPEPDLGTPVLIQLVVTFNADAPEAYAARLREVLAAAYTLAAQEDFDEDEVPVDTIPTWFVGISAPETTRTSTPPPAFAAEGSKSYTQRTGDTPWRIQDWLSRFDPAMEARGWEFWDVTQASDDTSRLHVWLDTWGEPFFAWEELRWLLHTCGAKTVSDPAVTDPDSWASEESL